MLRGKRSTLSVVATSYSLKLTEPSLLMNRRYMAEHPGAWDYSKSDIPAASTPEQEAKQVRLLMLIQSLMIRTLNQVHA